MAQSVDMRRALLIVVLLAGCFGGRSSRGPLEDTQWTVPIDGFQCSENLVFPDDVHYTYGVACALQDGTLGLQVMSGTYRVSGSDLTTTVTETSCPSSDVLPVDTVGWSRSGELLTIITDTGAFAMTRVYPDGTTGGSVDFGCFDSDLTFTPMPVHPL